MNTIWIVLPVLILLMFQLGMELNLAAFWRVLKRPLPVVVGLAGQLVLLPALAFAVGCCFQLPPVFFLGLILIACCPGGSSSNVFSLLAKGDVALSVILTTLSSVITLFTIPVVVALATRFVSLYSDVQIHLPVGQLIVQNLLLMFLPMLLGGCLRIGFPAVADRLRPVLGWLSFPALMLLAAVFFLQHYATIVRNFPLLGLTVAVLILLAMGGGWLMSRLARLKGAQRRTIVIEIGMQNAAQAIAMAGSPFIFHNEEMAIPAIIYALLMNVILLSYLKILPKHLDPVAG